MGTDTSYDDFRRQCGQQTADIVRIYGLPDILGHVYGVLLASPEPLALGDLTDVIGAAKSTVSVAARRLEALGLVQRTRLPGDRRDYYSIQEDVGQIVSHLLQRFLLPEAHAGVSMADDMVAAFDAGSGEGWPEGGSREALQQRIEGFRQLNQAYRGFLGGLLGPDGRPDMARIGALMTLLAPAPRRH